MKASTQSLSLLALAALAVIGLSACSKNESAPTGPTASKSDAAPTAAGGGVGITECDDYINKYQKCLRGKFPAAAQVALKTGFDPTIAQGKQTAATPEGKTGLAMACKAALDASKQAMTAYGCEW